MLGKLEMFWKNSGKSKGRKFLSMELFNVKSVSCRDVCSGIVYDSEVFM